jgi:hypothetical protein
MQAGAEEYNAGSCDLKEASADEAVSLKLGAEGVFVEKGWAPGDLTTEKKRAAASGSASMTAASSSASLETERRMATALGSPVAAEGEMGNESRCGDGCVNQEAVEMEEKDLEEDDGSRGSRAKRRMTGAGDTAPRTAWQVAEKATASAAASATPWRKMSCGSGITGWEKKKDGTCGRCVETPHPGLLSRAAMAPARITGSPLMAMDVRRRLVAKSDRMRGANAFSSACRRDCGRPDPRAAGRESLRT